MVTSEKLQGESFEAISDEVRPAKQASQSEEGFQAIDGGPTSCQADPTKGLPRLLGRLGFAPCAR